MKREHFRKKLEAEKVRLEAELGTVGRKNPRVPDDWEPIPSETGTEADLADQEGQPQARRQGQRGQGGGN